VSTMEIDKKQMLQEDCFSDCRSFGSNCRPYSQSRKISIGIMADMLAKSSSGVAAKQKVSAPSTEKTTSERQNSDGERHRQQEFLAAITPRQLDSPIQEKSPWVATRSSYGRTSNTKSGAAPNAKQTTSLTSSSGVHNRLNRERETPLKYSVHILDNQTTNLQSANAKHGKSDGTTLFVRKMEQVGTSEKTQEFSFATMHDILVSQKKMAERKTDKIESTSTEALRMKICEALGIISSPNKLHSNTQTLDADANNLMHSENEVEATFKPGQNTDSIETDSESPEHVVKRPVIRSLTQRRTSAKLQEKKVKKGPSSAHIQKQQEKNIFSFEGGHSGSLLHTSKSSSLLSALKKTGKKSCRVEPRMINLLEKDDAVKVQQAPEGRNIPLPAEKTILANNSVNLDKHTELKSGLLNRDSLFSSELLAHRQQSLGTPASPGKANKSEHSGNSSPIEAGKNQSPSFTLKTPFTSRPAPASLIQKTTQTEEASFESAPSKRKSIRESFNTLLAFSLKYYDSNELRPTDNSGKCKDSPGGNSMPSMEETNAQCELSGSSSEEDDLDNSQEGSPIHKGNGDTEKLFPDTVGSEEGNEFQEGSELSQEDGLARAVTLFALALGRVESKLKSVTSKKSSEILTSVAEGIQLQLQKVESQIQKDIGRVSSLGISKRKHMEKRFQEHQQHLKLIHKKFTEEVNHNLQNCRSAVEGLEAHQIEFKGTIERQKALHRKILLQVEEAIHTQLSDAQERIIETHKASFMLARDKMAQLKHMIAKDLEEAILN
ncbi:Meiosis-specific protein ASY3-like, coiled-coil, partial [Dillenia turbinata]